MDKVSRTFCRICVASCGLLVTTRDGVVIDVSGDRDHPLSQGYTCPKGRSAGAINQSPARVNGAFARGTDGSLSQVTWAEALTDIAARVSRIVEDRGPDSIAMYTGNGGGVDTAGAVTSRKFIRSVGSRSLYSSATIDAPGRYYVTELITGNASLSCHHVDADRATLTLLVGVNPVVSHGHYSAFPNPRARLKKLASAGELWVVDPRRTESAALATQHLAPVPGTDFALLGAVLHELLRDSAVVESARQRADGVDDLVDAVSPFTLEAAAGITGLRQEDIAALVAAIRRHGRVAVIPGTGVSMTSRANLTEWFSWALSIVTDSVDRPGGVWVHPGFFRGLDRRAATPPKSAPGPASRPDLPSRLGEMPTGALTDEIEAGNVRALFVVGGNPLLAIPDSDRLRRALAGLELVVVLDITLSLTADVASHVLGVADMLERADLTSASDQFSQAISAQYAPAVISPALGRRAMWEVFAELGDLLGTNLRPGGMAADRCTEIDVIASAARHGRRPFSELVAADQCIVDEASTFDWLLPNAVLGGRYAICPAELVSQLEAAMRETHAPTNQIMLVPRRQLRHMNSILADNGTADGRVDESTLLLNPVDASRLGLRNGQDVLARSEYGSWSGRLEVTASIRIGAASIPHGHASGNVNTLLACQDLDPYTGMPAMSAVPISVSAR